MLQSVDFGKFSNKLCISASRASRSSFCSAKTSTSSTASSPSSTTWTQTPTRTTRLHTKDPRSSNAQGNGQTFSSEKNYQFSDIYCVALCYKRCKIDWNPGKNVTVKLVKKTQKHKARGMKRTVTKTVQNDSFFNFFSPPQGTVLLHPLRNYRTLRPSNFTIFVFLQCQTRVTNW